MIKRLINRVFPPSVGSESYFADGGKCCERCGWPTLMGQYKLEDETIRRLYCPNCRKIQNSSSRSS